MRDATIQMPRSYALTSDLDCEARRELCNERLKKRVKTFVFVMLDQRCSCESYGFAVGEIIWVRVGPQFDGVHRICASCRLIGTGQESRARSGDCQPTKKVATFHLVPNAVLSGGWLAAPQKNRASCQPPAWTHS